MNRTCARVALHGTQGYKARGRFTPLEETGQDLNAGARVAAGIFALAHAAPFLESNMSANVELQAEAREKVGKGAARAIRRAGQVPAVIYGDKKDPRAIALAVRDVVKELEAGRFLTTVYDVKVDGESARVIPRDFQMDPVRDTPMHVDFLRITKGATIVVAIPVNFLNEEESPGLKRGGVLNVVRHEIEVSAPAESLPDGIDIDLTGLDIGDSLHISAVALPEGVEPTITDRDFTIATIAAPAGLKDDDEEGDEELAEGAEVPTVAETEAAAEEGGEAEE